MFAFGIKDIIDILLVALMLYYIYRLMKESRSLNVFIGIIVFVMVWLFVSQVLEMRLLGAIMDKLVSVGVIGLIVLFQEEIRRFLYSLGAHQRFKQFTQLFMVGGKDKKKLIETISSYLDIEPEYQGPPTKGYIIGRYMVLYNGNILSGEDNEEKIDALIGVLSKAGFRIEEDVKKRINL